MSNYAIIVLNLTSIYKERTTQTNLQILFTFNMKYKY